jgi:spore coat protein U-like protein
MNTKSAGILLVLAMAGLAANANAAGTDTKTFNVNITITSTCDIHTTAATDVSFGSIASTATNVDNAGALVVNCTSLTPYTIALDNGQNGTDVATRKMKNGAVFVPYQLYKLPARAAADVWGSTGGVSGNVYSNVGTGANQTVPVYGRVPSANFPALTYADVITATVAY